MFSQKNKLKVFCIGTNKTGTTSLEKALKDFNYKMGDQVKGELLLNDYANRDFKKIIDFCKTAEAFQDAPFCFKYTYIALDQYFTNAKFILTVRDSDTQWYQSLVNFHSQLFADGKRVPTWDDLKRASYRYKGFLADARKKVFGIFEDEQPYNEVKFKAYYNSHNTSVCDYFKNKNNLLVLNLSDEDSYLKLSKFLDKTPLYENFPWENKTRNI